MALLPSLRLALAYRKGSGSPEPTSSTLKELRGEPPSQLPEGQYFGLTWTIPEQFGGLTSVLLHRSSLFAGAGGRPVDILTLAPDLDPAAKARDLSSAGKLGEGTRLRNLWSELSAMTDDALAAFAARAEVSPGVTDSTAAESSETATIEGTDRLRPDGSRYASDRPNAEWAEGPKGRRLTVYSRDGAPLGSWRSARALYFAWLDEVIGDDPSYLINDSQFIGGFLGGYQRANVVKVQVLHNTHLRDDTSSPYGPLAEGKAAMIEGLDEFDLVAVLTDRQRKELSAAGLAVHNARTIPNSLHIAPHPPTPRPRGAGVMVARLTTQKRVAHAVRAMALVCTEEPGASLTIYGDGDERAELDTLIDELGLRGRVELAGFDPHAADRFLEASFSVLSSRFEGMPLVLVESMAHGCLPIAYDVRYGPSDIITSGINGVIVRPGDVSALAEAILATIRLPRNRLAVMRDAATARARDFSNELVLKRWGAELIEARERKRLVHTLSLRVRLSQIDLSSDGLALRGTILGSLGPEHPHVHLAWRGRGEHIFGRVAADCSTAGADTMRFTAMLPRDRTDALPSGLLDLYVDVLSAGSTSRTRLSTAGAEIHASATKTDNSLYVTTAGNLSLRIRRPS